MGEYRGKEWQVNSTSVRERMEHLFNNMDMADIHILAVDEDWWWGQTVKDFTAHRLVLCAASPVFHQLFYPAENGPEIPACMKLSQTTTNNMAKIELTGIPPIAMEALLEYCYRDRFDKKDFENGYSRNLLWRLWQTAKLLKIKHLFDLCSEALEVTMCEETVFWDLNYSITYSNYGTDNIKNKVCGMIESLGNSLYEHPNLVWLDSGAVRELLSLRTCGKSEPVIVFNNLLRWCLYQLDRTVCDEVDGKRDADITLQQRLDMIENIRQGKVKDYGFCDISKYLDRILDLVPWSEFSQKEFLHFIVPSKILNQEQLLSAAISVMEQVASEPQRLSLSAYSLEIDPTKYHLKQDMHQSHHGESPITRSFEVNASDCEKLNQVPKQRTSIKSSLEQARLRRTMAEQARLRDSLSPSKAGSPAQAELEIGANQIPKGEHDKPIVEPPTKLADLQPKDKKPSNTLLLVE